MVVGSVCCGITKSVLLEMGLGEGGCGDLHCSAVDGGIFRDARTTSGVSISRVIRHCLDKADMPGNAGGCSVFPLTFELTLYSQVEESLYLSGNCHCISRHVLRNTPHTHTHI